jgi:hypothetical protein
MHRRFEGTFYLNLKGRNPDDGGNRLIEMFAPVHQTICRYMKKVLILKLYRNFSNMKPCSPLKANRRFGGRYLHNHRCESFRSYMIYIYLRSMNCLDLNNALNATITVMKRVTSLVSISNLSRRICSRFFRYALMEAGIISSVTILVVPQISLASYMASAFATRPFRMFRVFRGFGKPSTLDAA